MGPDAKYLLYNSHTHSSIGSHIFLLCCAVVGRMVAVVVAGMWDELCLVGWWLWLWLG